VHITVQGGGRKAGMAGAAGVRRRPGLALLLGSIHKQQPGRPYASIDFASNRGLGGAPTEAQSDEGLRKRLEIEGADPVGNTSAEFGKVIKDGIAMWGKVATAAGIPPK